MKQQRLNMNLHKIKTIVLVTMVMVFAYLNVDAFAAGRHLDVRIGQHKKYTRMVFDWPKMVGYKASQSGQQVEIVFSSETQPDLSKLPLSKYPYVQSIQTKSGKKGTLTLVINLAPGVVFKDQRLLRKIILDFSKSPAQQTAKKTIHSKKHKTIQAKTKSVAPIMLLPSKKPPVQKGETNKSKQTSQIESELTARFKQQQKKQPDTPIKPEIKDQIKVAPVAQENLKPTQAEKRRTVITVSTVDDANLAVFKRFGYLWLVLDSENAGVPPQRFGPHSGFLGEERVIPIKGGIAYRYTYPAGSFVTVAKDDYTWQVTVTTNSKTPILSSIRIAPVFDNGKSRLVAEVSNTKKILQLKDPVSGDALWIVPTGKPGQRVDTHYIVPELEVLSAYQGLVVWTKNDDIEVKRSRKRVEMTSPKGLILTRGISAIPVQIGTENGSLNGKRLFDFPAWRQGGLDHLIANRREMEKELIKVKNPQDRSRILMRLALLHFSNHYTHEALGYLSLALEAKPSLLNSPSFRALRGGTRSLAGRYVAAIDDLSVKALVNQEEAKLWRGYAAASSEQWRMAAREFPKDNRLLLGYPASIAIPFTILMAESALRVGDVDRAKELLNTLNVYSGDLEPRFRSGIEYLKGEAYRQDKKYDKAIEKWEPIVEGRDRLYHAKAGLALTNVLYTEGLLSEEDAIKKLDVLRYAWRGDGLEIQILYNIGVFKIKAGKYSEGLNLMRKAVELAKGNLDDSKPITNAMRKAFHDLFVGGKSKNIPTIEAISLFDGFSELRPVGAEGHVALQNFAEQLIKMDLLDRASETLREEVAYYSGKVEGARLGARLALVYMMDEKASDAIKVLKQTDLKKMPLPLREQRAVLKAKAYALLSRPKKAIEILSSYSTPQAHLLKAEIYWKDKNWPAVAAELEKVLPPAGVDQITLQDARNILNRAVALALAGDKKGILDIRFRYKKLMKKTKFGPSFVVVTRDAGISTLSDKNTMKQIASEVDIFNDFFKSYQQF